MASGARIEEGKLKGIPTLRGKVWHTNKHKHTHASREGKRERQRYTGVVMDYLN